MAMYLPKRYQVGLPAPLLKAACLLWLIAAHSKPAQGGEAQGEPLIEYRVRPGDTLDRLARQRFGDLNQVVRIAKDNNLGQPARALRPGEVLHLLPDSWVASVSGTVTRAGSEVHAGDPLSPNDEILTAKGASVEIAFPDGTWLELGESSHLAIASYKGSATFPKTVDTTLIGGTLRLKRAFRQGQLWPVTLALRNGKIRFTDGEGVVVVPPNAETAVAVYRGSIALAPSKGPTVPLAGGQHCSLTQQVPACIPQPLPPSPVWIEYPQLLLTQEEQAEALLEFQAGIGATPARVLVQLAKDDLFKSVVYQESMASSPAKVRVSLHPGTYYGRVVPMVREGIMGTPTFAAKIRVAKVRQSAKSIDVETGLFCALGDGELQEVRKALLLPPGKARTLRCAVSKSGLGAASLVLRASTLQHQVSAGPATQKGEYLERQVTLRLFDETQTPVSGAEILVRPSDGVLMSTPKEVHSGEYLATVFYHSDPVEIFFYVNRSEEIRATLPRTPPPKVASGRPTIEMQLAGSVYFSDLQKGDYGLGLRLGVAGAFPLRVGSLVLGVRALAESMSYYEGAVRAPCQMGSPGTLCIMSRNGNYANLFARALVTLSVPLMYRLGQPNWAVQPYVGLEPSLVLDFTQSEVIDLANQVAFAQHPGVSVLGGLLVRPGPERHGSALIEVAYRHVGIEERRKNDASLSGAMLFFGYHLAR